MTKSITLNRDYGVICTCQNPEGHRMTLHRSAGTSQALREVCDYLDALDEGWRIICVSTPATIYRDLQGTRAENGRPPTPVIVWPEATLLGKIGRRDLWAGPPSPSTELWQGPRLEGRRS